MPSSAVDPVRDPLFTVIVPTYNRPALLAEAVDSVLRQSVDDLECLVVHDGGPEPIRLPDDPRVHLLPLPRNGGVAAARNAGIRSARGRYVTFLDDDDVLTPDRLAMALRGLERGPVSICWVAFLGRTGNGSGRVLEGDVSDSILDGLTPNVGAAVVDRAVVPLFDERFRALQDVEWWLRLARTLPVATEPRVGYLFRLHPGARHRNGIEARVRLRLQLLEENGEYFRTHTRAAAFQWKRLGLHAGELGAHGVARGAFVNSLRLRPDGRTLWHLARSVRRSTTSAQDLGLQAGT